MPPCHGPEASGRVRVPSGPQKKRLSKTLGLFCFSGVFGVLYFGYMMFYTYILQSETDSSYYIGYTSNLHRRLEEHNGGLSPHTSHKRPWRLVYFEYFEEKTHAIRRELFLKRMKSRDFVLRLVKEMIEVG